MTLLTLQEAERLGIVDRLKVPLLPIAAALDDARNDGAKRYDSRLSRWLERQTLVEAWQFIELSPQRLRARSQDCGLKKIEGINDLLRTLNLPCLGTPLTDELVRRRLGHTMDWGNPQEFELRSAMMIRRDAWQNKPRSPNGGKADYSQFYACDARMTALAKRYLENLAEAQGAM